MPDAGERRSTLLRTWLFPLSILGGAAFTVFVLAAWVDVSGSHDPLALVELVVRPNPAAAQAALANAGQVITAVLGIAITVVAIIVELASNRYTHRITELFVREPVNFVVMGFFVVTALQSMFSALMLDNGPGGSGFVPYLSIGISIGMLTLSLLILLPYFAFVFEFLNPVSIVNRIRAHTLDVVKKERTRPRSGARPETVRGIEQLADVALNAMENKDKGVSMASVDALRTLVIDYQAAREGLPEAWFTVDGELAHNPDFVSMAPEVLDEVRVRRYWLELKVLRQYQTLYNEALNRMRDINYLIAINTRLVAEAALRGKNEALVELVIKFFNTYLRATINARDVRTAYNVLNQYRLLAEAALTMERGERAVEIAKYFKYYGLLSFSAKLPFILETVAYDLCALNELAFDKRSKSSRDILRIFLEVDKESEGDVQETSLRGVRKAQVKLAAYYLVKGDEELARVVYRDMASERTERLASIRDELLNVMSAVFWGISDRGRNFDYLDPKRKAKMLQFFEWFGDILPPRASLVRSVTGEMASVAPDSAPTPARTSKPDELPPADGGAAPA